MNPHTEQANEILRAAVRDRTTFLILRKVAESPHESMLFHAQQAAEKFIKAVLVQRAVFFRRTHDLLELATLAEENQIDLPVSRDLLARLTPYAVEFRYLGVQAPDVTAEEAESAVVALDRWATACLQ
jgi:HEPN domain-containing protein